jgi:hypothetical protein
VCSTDLSKVCLELDWCATLALIAVHSVLILLKCVYLTSLFLTMENSDALGMMRMVIVMQ